MDFRTKFSIRFIRDFRAIDTERWQRLRFLIRSRQEFSRRYEYHFAGRRLQNRRGTRIYNGPYRIDDLGEPAAAGGFDEPSIASISRTNTGQISESF